jgi:hypothetical protein
MKSPETGSGSVAGNNVAVGRVCDAGYTPQSRQPGIVRFLCAGGMAAGLQQLQ